MDSMLTAVVPIHQMAGKLQNLRSWLAKSQEIQIVLVNDLSDDLTHVELEEMVKKMSSSDIQLVKGHFGSPGASRNKGLELVKTEFVTFWDSDDLPDPVKFIEMCRILKFSGAQVCVGEYEIINLRNQKVTVKEILHSDVNHNVAITPGVWRMVFRSDSIPNKPFTNLRLAEDHIFLQEVKFPTMEKRVFRERVYTYFYAGEDNLTSNRSLIPDLRPALLRTNQFRKEALSESEIEFSSILLVREFLTMVKKGSITLKLQVIFILARIICDRKRRTVRDIFSAFKIILEQR